MSATYNKTAENPVDPIFADLNLDSVGKNLFIGHYESVPFRMELVSNEQTFGLLFQTRFSNLKQPIPEFPNVPDGGRLQSLIEEKKAEYTADEDRAWFNLFAAHELIERGELLDVLKEFAASIKSYVDFDDQPCFACKQTKATQPIYYSEKLHLICDACRERLNQKSKMLAQVDPADVVFSLLWAAVVSIVGGVIWSLAWMAYDFIFAGLRLPNIVFIIAFLAIGAAVALPIAWVFKKIPRRGARLGNVIMTFACLLTAILGEVFLCDFFFYRELHALPDLGQTFALWLAVMAESGSFYVIGKIITIGIMWAITTEKTNKNISLEEVAAPTAR